MMNRVVGSLLGLAVGDAVGTTVEFMPPGSFDPVTDMKGGGKLDLLPGQVAIYCSLDPYFFLHAEKSMG